jgi:hypothetical protein
MFNTKLKLTLCLAAVAATTVVTQGQTTASAPSAGTAPQMTAYDKWENDVRNPAPWFSWGADLRFRNEYFDNAVTLTDDALRHEQDYFRYRGRVWASVIPMTNLSFNARLSAEPRTWVNDSYSSTFGPTTGTEWRYGIFDNLYAKWANAFDVPLTISAGRQDVQFGEPLNWWLVADGTPGDGSWTFFLDSIRFTFDAKEIKTKFDIVGIYQRAHPDEWMPTLGCPSYRNYDYMLTEQDESGVIVYASNKSIKNTTIDAYFIYKGDDRVTVEKAGNSSLSGDNADIYTLGGKISGQPSPHWNYSVEGAYQFGNKEDSINDGVGGAARFAERDISAYGANAKLTYLFKDKLNNQASLVFEYLSGDDPSTSGKDEMFDILWGRWPRWSEMYIYSYVYETSGKIAQLNNVARIGASWSCSLTKKTTVNAMYNALLAPEETPSRRIGPAATLFSNNGNFRGHYVQAIVKHQFNKHLSGHLWSEFLWQGDYYNQRDLMTFLRAEMMFAF